MNEMGAGGKQSFLPVSFLLFGSVADMDIESGIAANRRGIRGNKKQVMHYGGLREYTETEKQTVIAVKLRKNYSTIPLTA